MKELMATIFFLAISSCFHLEVSNIHNGFFTELEGSISVHDPQENDTHTGKQYVLFSPVQIFRHEIPIDEIPFLLREQTQIRLFPWKLTYQKNELMASSFFQTIFKSIEKPNYIVTIRKTNEDGLNQTKLLEQVVLRGAVAYNEQDL